MGYLAPANVPISDTRAGHIRRGSKEPGTDYATPYGTDLIAPGDGVILSVDPNPGGAEGRRISFLMDDTGEVIDWIHLSEIMMRAGQRIGRGTKGIAKSGASGFGKDWYYGPHVHVTRRARQGLPYSQTLDFQAAVEGGGGGGSAPASADVAKGQRTAGGNGVRRRKQPTSKSAENGEMLKPGTVGNFTGWIRGEKVDGIDTWFQGISGDWFWAGGFTQGANTTGLKDLNPKTPAPKPDPKPTSTQRKVGPNGARRRESPSSKAAEAGEMLAPGTIGNFNGWARGEKVEGNDVWFRGTSGDWFWSGGFEGGPVTAGLPEISIAPPVTPPKPVDPKPTPNADNPRNLPVYKPVYPGAKIGLVAPLTMPRGEKGIPPVKVENKIDIVQEHWTGVTADQLDWFSTDNSRGSCPNWFIRPDGTVYELIRPGMKPALAGPEWNWRSLGWEIQMVEGGKGTPEQFEAVCQLLAWIHSYDGKVLDGTPVTFPLDRDHFKAHRELVATECPGDWWFSQMDAQLARARVIYAEKYAPEQPEEPDTGDLLLARAKALIEQNNALLEEIVAWAEGA
ncbi:endolysin [Microbacterium phage SadLad]|nr:lysin A [Microbacterium phage RubyRalph]QUE25595.1 endolysin [Microbacterium phage SadLad]